MGSQDREDMCQRSECECVNVYACVSSHSVCVCAGGDGFVMKTAGSQRSRVPLGG